MFLSKVFYILKNYNRFFLKYLNKFNFVQGENWYNCKLLVLSDIIQSIIEIIMRIKNVVLFFF